MSEKNFFNGKTAWITGASSGIGEATAKRLAGLNVRVIISSNDIPELNRVEKEIKEKGRFATSLPFDLSNPVEVENAADLVLTNNKNIHFLFNNAGISQRNTVLNTPIEIDRKIMEINYFSGIILTKKLLPHMIENGGGHIIITSSISGVFGFPLRSAYAAAKHALHGFYESLWTENYSKNIRTTVICPGRVKTNISFNAIGKNGLPHGRMDEGQAGGISPDRCAKQILKAVRKDRRQVFIGGKEIILARIKQYLPCLFYKLVIKIKPY